MTSRLALVLAAAFLISCGTPQTGASRREEEHRSAIVPNAAVTYAAERGLVDVRALLPDVVCDLRYGTKHNINEKKIQRFAVLDLGFLGGLRTR